ncbi:MAG: hypothetical protein Q9204_005272 [Flavoplaca sp. TL-2023a]
MADLVPNAEIGGIAVVADDPITHLKVAVREAFGWLLYDALPHLLAYLKSAAPLTMEKLYTAAATGFAHLKSAVLKGFGWLVADGRTYLLAFFQTSASWATTKLCSGAVVMFIHLKSAVLGTFHWLVSDGPGHPLAYLELAALWFVDWLRFGSISAISGLKSISRHGSRLVWNTAGAVVAKTVPTLQHTLIIGKDTHNAVLHMAHLLQSYLWGGDDEMLGLLTAFLVYFMMAYLALRLVQGKRLVF